MRKLSQNLFLGLFCSSLMLAGCGGGDDADLTEEAGLQADVDDKADRAAIPVTPFTDNIGTRGQTETRVLFTTAASYKSYFGHAAPASVNFGTEWVVFYSAGSKNTGGYQASVQRVRLSDSGLTIKVTTSLESPGVGCIVTQAFTKPHQLVKFKKPTPRPFYVSYYRNDTLRNCGATGPFCGGIAGIQCPGAGTCVDNPNDSCNPATGGRDCGGVCECNALGFCIGGFVWDSSPEVCGCVADPASNPCAAVRCAAGTHCEVTPIVCVTTPCNPIAECKPDVVVGACNSDSDCKLSDNYCGGCACDALGPGQTPTTCSNPVNCFVQPCMNKVAKCDLATHKCTAAPKPAGVPCGSVTCPTDQVCCNASCGICTPPGNFCIQIACGQ
jgi:hypothetical protein